MQTTRRGYLAVAAGSVAWLAGCLGGDGSAGGESCDAAPEGTVSELDTPVAGDPEADVTVAAFEDFSCPHCRTYHLETFPQVREEFVDPGRVRYEHHDLPVPVDETWSWAAAGAARAVQDEAGDEAFFEYAHALFENQGDYSTSLVGELAEQVDATPCAVRAAAENGTYRPVIEADRQAGIDRGVEATPTVFVDDRAVEATPSAIRSAIESRL